MRITVTVKSATPPVGELPPEFDVLDDRDRADIRVSLDEVARGEYLDWKTSSGEMRQRFNPK
jgi:hypothetical protein